MERRTGWRERDRRTKERPRELERLALRDPEPVRSGVTILAVGDRQRLMSALSSPVMRVRPADRATSAAPYP
jgi:hypothetical protein